MVSKPRTAPAPAAPAFGIGRRLHIVAIVLGPVAARVASQLFNRTAYGRSTAIVGRCRHDNAVACTTYEYYDSCGNTDDRHTACFARMVTRNVSEQRPQIQMEYFRGAKEY